jgi:hypothetical protein
MQAITQKNLQNIFDVNGLDSYSSDDSLRTNQLPNGDVIIDDKLYSYLTPFNCIIDTIQNKGYQI